MGQITKGYTYDTGTNKVVTAANLNAHVDAAVLAAGSITEQTAETTTAVDDVALVYDLSATALRKVTLANLVPDAAITAAKLAATLNLTGKTVTLAGGEISDGELAATLDFTAKSVTFAPAEISAGELEVELDLSGKTLTLPATMMVTKGTPGTAAIPATGAIATIAHGLSGKPDMFRVVIEFTGTVQGWSSGDEVDITGISGQGGLSPFHVYADGTNINVLRRNVAEMGVYNKGTGAYQDVAGSTASMRLKAYFWK